MDIKSLNAGRMPRLMIEPFNRMHVIKYDVNVEHRSESTP